jgi:hypothetical protein
MSLKIETPMAMIKTQDMAADRIRDTRAQSLNPALMENEENRVRDEEMHRTQSLEETEFNRVDENSPRGGGAESRGADKGGAQEDAAQSKPPDEETLRLQRQAAERLLGLPVDIGKFAAANDRRIDISL